MQKKPGTGLMQSIATLKAHGFRFLFMGTVCINFAQWFQQIGLGWLVFQLTGSATQMGAITGTQGIFLLLGSPVAGILTDRVNRRKLLISTTAINAVQSLLLAVLVSSGLAHLWHLYAYAVIAGTANAITQPVRQAFIYDLVGREGIARAVPINQFAFSAARVVGPALAGAVIGFTGTANVFYLQAVLAIAAMGFTFFIGPTEQKANAAGRESPLKTLTQGWRYAVSTPALMGQLCIGLIPTLLVYPYVGFLPFFAEKLDAGAQGYGILATGAGYGGMMGLVVIAMMGDIKRKGKLLVTTMFLYPCTVLLFALTHNFPLAMVCLVLAGFANAFNMAMQNTLFLLNAREDMRGRVMSLYTMTSGLQPIGSYTLGVAISHWGPNQAVFAFMLVAIASAAICAVAFPAVRKA